MDPTIKEKKFAITVTNQRLPIYISGQNARHLYKLKINNINNKTDFNGPTIISLFSGGGNFLCRTRWDMSPTLPYALDIGLWPYIWIIKIDNKVGFLSKICVSYNILISFNFIKVVPFSGKTLRQLLGGGHRPPNPPLGALPLNPTGGTNPHIGSRSRARHKMVDSFTKS